MRPSDWDTVIIYIIHVRQRAGRVAVSKSPRSLREFLRGHGEILEPKSSLEILSPSSRKGPACLSIPALLKAASGKHDLRAHVAGEVRAQLLGPLSITLPAVGGC